MNRRKGSSRRLILSASTILVLLSTGAVVLSKKRQDPEPQKHAATFKAELVNSVPQVSSKVKALAIAGVRIIDQGTPKAALAIDIVNNLDQPVMALELSSGDDNDSSDLGIDGLVNPLHPQALIPPHSLKTFNWSFGEILKDYPVIISAATFGNGQEDGTALGIEMLHQDRKRAEADRERAAKQAPQPK